MENVELKFFRAKISILQNLKKLDDDYSTFINEVENIKSFKELFEFLKSNFFLLVEEEIITSELLNSIGLDLCGKNGIFYNVGKDHGYTLIEEGKFNVGGIANVAVKGYSKVNSSGSAKVVAFDDAIINCSEFSEVFSSHTVNQYPNPSCRITATGNCKVNVYGTTTVNASDNCEVYANDSCRVKAKDKCKVSLGFDSWGVFEGEVEVFAYHQTTVTASKGCTVSIPVEDRESVTVLGEADVDYYECFVAKLIEKDINH